MKSLIQAVVVATVLATPVVSFAQSDQPVTREQVRQELIQLEHAGYNPSQSNDANYPSDIQAAEKRVQDQNVATAQQQPVADTSGYGPATSGSSASGGTQLAPHQRVFFGN
ncbi:DUF4148 domain-containing protein [Paraburkholderia sp. BL10I2N1]|uniref:DUF4148 domain-containing protein n=1 Tax=Paraburkholderia sp. BL10I2N1 TaxID=1938796 RepID=UPI00105EF835|nr:DUF4148 domain-containing protein [Paraburkholderia sp. BL10I2N1]TDN61319.1 uncharacterized protein DUF4148 [Paraburkholderia sp. BL10I2N1]